MKLSDYIRGFRKGKEAHRLEKEAMRDPFLADALEGYSRVESGADEQIELLRRRVNMRVTQKRRHTIAWSVAASLLIGIFSHRRHQILFLFFLLYRQRFQVRYFFHCYPCFIR